MKTLKLGICVLALAAMESGFAAAAWNSVFQATLTSRPGQSPRTQVLLATSNRAINSASAVLTCDNCNKPTQQCTTRYIQRTCYEPVTTYQTKAYCEQVTTYQTSYYYEPVTSYRYTCAYDPCTCSYQQVATPCTSYQLRSQCCPVTSWVQRCCQEPVTTYRQSCYYEPVTTCCTTTVGAPVSSAPSQSTYSAPVITEQRSSAPPVINEQRTSPPVVDVPAAPPTAAPLPDGAYNGGSYYPNTSSRQQRNYRPAPAAKPPAPAVNLDRVVVGPNRIEGQVVRSDRTPRPNTVVTFVRVDSGASQKAMTNYAGRFNVSLASGAWLVYLQNPDGTRQYHNRLDVNGQQPAPIRLVSRSR